MNKVELSGFVGQDGQLRYTGSGLPVLSFTLATSDTPKKGEAKGKTEWHKCVAWRGLAEALSGIVVKGALLFVIGRLQTRSWEQDGQKKYITEVVVDQAGQLVMPKKKDSDDGRIEPEPPNARPDNDSDLPF